MHRKDELSRELINTILQGYIDKLFAFALKRTGNRQEAEDLSQDIVYEILRSAESLKDVRAFHGWMWTIAKNTWKRWLSKKSHNQVECYDALNMVLFDNSSNLESAVILDEEINLLRRELALLSETVRRVTVLHYIEDKSCEEISNILNISLGMVKQHLFKARKLIKDGICMNRELGEKSYNPKDFVFGFWGELGTLYYKMFERKIPKNIVMSAYEKPLTIEEISVDTGIPRPYLEEEIKILLEGDVLSNAKNGYYQTNFIIILKELQEKVERVLTEASGPFSVKLLESFNSTEQEIRDIGFCGSQGDWKKLLWTLIPLSIFSTLNKIQAEFLAQPPLLKTGVRGWPNARERELDVWDFGVYNHFNPANSLGYWSCNFQNSQKRTSYIYGPNDRQLEFLQTLYNSWRDIAELNEEEKEVAAVLIDQGFIRKENQRLIDNFIGFDSSCYSELIRLENRDRTFVYHELKNLLSDIADMLDKEVPKHLREQVKAHAFMSLVYVVSNVMKNLTQQRMLDMPTENEKNTYSFCMFKGFSGIIPR